MNHNNMGSIILYTWLHRMGFPPISAMMMCTRKTFFSVPRTSSTVAFRRVVATMLMHLGLITCLAKFMTQCTGHWESCRQSARGQSVCVRNSLRSVALHFAKWFSNRLPCGVARFLCRQTFCAAYVWAHLKQSRDTLVSENYLCKTARFVWARIAEWLMWSYIYYTFSFLQLHPFKPYYHHESVYTNQNHNT